MSIVQRADETERAGSVADMPYEAFLAERQKIVEARQRVLQRIDQLVTTGAAGALVLSVTFLEKIVPAPLPDTRWILVAAWTLLLTALGCNLWSHFVGVAAFDQHLDSFDKAYRENRPFAGGGRTRLWVRLLRAAGAVLFVVGVAALAWFSFSNLNFTTEV